VATIAAVGGQDFETIRRELAGVGTSKKIYN